MNEFKRLSDSQLEIMKAIWKMEAPVTVSRLLSVFKEKKWKSQTLCTFLTRLVDKGVLHVERINNTNIYTPLLSEQEYNRIEAKNLLELMYSGSIKNFLSALYSDNNLNEKETDEIKEWFKKAGD